MKISQKSISLIEEAILKAIAPYKSDSHSTTVTDIHLQPNLGTGNLSIFNDEDQELADTHIEEWVDYPMEGFYSGIENILSNLLTGMKERGEFDDISILKPYSFVLVDSDKETLAELLLVDEDTLLLNEGLLKGLDEELDAFLKELLEK
ncbi:MAG: hypothetical protein IJ494_09650 [Bacteroides sp.]|nr:hypothetical protein [Bacteroides sp.]